MNIRASASEFYDPFCPLLFQKFFLKICPVLIGSLCPAVYFHPAGGGAAAADPCTSQLRIGIETSCAKND